MRQIRDLAGVDMLVGFFMGIPAYGRPMTGPSGTYFVYDHEGD